MPVETIDKTIDGLDFQITTFGAIKGQKIQTRLIKITAPGAGPLINLLKGLDFEKDRSELIKEFLDGEVDLGIIAKALQEVLQSAGDEDQIQSFIFRLLEKTTVKYAIVEGDMRVHELSQENIFDVVFQGRYMTMYKLLVAVIQVNKFFGSGGTSSD